MYKSQRKHLQIRNDFKTVSLSSLVLNLIARPKNNHCSIWNGLGDGEAEWSTNYTPDLLLYLLYVLGHKLIYSLKIPSMLALKNVFLYFYK